MSKTRRALRTCGLVLAVALVATTTSARGADWPSRPVVVLDGFAPGGASDVLMRLMAVEMTKGLAQQVVVENRAGASGHIAAQAVARAKSDGHTIMIHTATLTSSRTMFPTLEYDLLRDLAPITQIARVPWVFVVNPALPVKNVREFLALAKRRPGELVFAAVSLGSMAHMIDEKLKEQAGIQTVNVPYRGAAPATVAVLSGEAAYSFIVPTVVRPHADAGKLRMLAVSTIRRSAVLPDVPTMDESGLKGIDIPQWFGIWAPAKTPPEIIERLHREFLRVLALPPIRERFLREGAEVVGSSPVEFAAFVSSELARWTDLGQRIGLKAKTGK